MKWAVTCCVVLAALWFIVIEVYRTTTHTDPRTALILKLASPAGLILFTAIGLIILLLYR